MRLGFARPSNRWTAIDLFCGAGGLSHGFEVEGFDILAGNDSDGFAGETFSLAHPKSTFLHQPIETLGAATLLDTTKIKVGELDCLIGGPPCQGFSTAGGRDGSDPRNKLIFEYLNIVSTIKPRWFLFENVEGILTSNRGISIASLIEQLVEFGYCVRLEKVNFASYGLPQARKRVVIIGNRIGLDFSFPQPTHSFDAGKHKSASHLPLAPSLYEALAGLDMARSSPTENSPYSTFDAASNFDALMRLGNSKQTVSLHYSTNRDKLLTLYKMLKPGQTMRDLPQEFWHESYRKRAFRRVADGMPTEKRGGAPSGLKRLKGHLNALTITGAATREFIHPDHDRPLTIREAARLQSFPDCYEFCGPLASVSRQIGNAFPPLAAQIFARHIKALDYSFGSDRRQTAVLPVPRLLGFRLTDSTGKSPALAKTEQLLERLQNTQPYLSQMAS